MPKEKDSFADSSEQHDSEDFEDIYEEDQREEQLEDDEISPAEAGFVEGYEKLRFAKCKQCNKGIDLEKSFELEIEGNDYLFCSEKCAKKFEEKHEKKAEEE